MRRATLRGATHEDIYPLAPPPKQASGDGGGTAIMDESARTPRLANQELVVTWSDFGPFLKRLRMRRGISQQRLAAQLGCDRTYIWRLEHGRNHPSRIFLRSLGQTYALAIEEAAAVASFVSLRVFALDGSPME